MAAHQTHRKYIYIHESQFSWSQRHMTVRRTFYLDYKLSPIYCLPANEKEHTFLNRGTQLAHVAQLTAIHLDLAPISHKTSALGQCLTAFWSRASKDSLLEQETYNTVLQQNSLEINYAKK